MEDITNWHHVPKEKTAVALGLFDGVHKGHQLVISRVVDSKPQYKATVFTFKTDTVTSKGYGGKIQMLINDEEKQRRFDEQGVDYIYCSDFSSLKDMSDEDFVRKILIGKLNAGYVACGADFRFGKGAMGNAQRLCELGRKYGIKVEVVNQLVYNGEVISSTEIRNLISEGKISQANKLLGYNYGYTLYVEHGFHRGSTWDFPTINQSIPKGLVLPKFGVYCSKVTIDGEAYRGVTNIGVKPTVKENIAGPLAETFIIDFSGDLYGQIIKIELYEFVRPERMFDSFDELKAEISRNTEFTKQYFADSDKSLNS